MIPVLGFGLTTKDRELIHKMLTSCGLDLTLCTLHDLRAEGTDSIGIRERDDIEVIITFGKRVANIIKPSTKLMIIELPEIKKLYPVDEGGEEEAREVAWKTLTDLNSAMGKGRLSLVEDRKLLDSITEDSIPDLEIYTIAKLREALKKTERTSWTCSTQSGKIVRISLEPTKSDADIDITFDELIALRSAMDIFKISEVQFGKPVSKGTDQEGSN